MARSDEAVLAAIVEQAVDLALVLDEEGTVVWQRRSDTRRPDALDSHAVGVNIVERIHPEDLPKVLDGLARVREPGTDEVRISCRAFDGTDPTLVHQAEVRAVDATDVPGVEGVLVVATVQDSRHDDRADVGTVDFSLADASPLGLAIVSAEGEIHYANELFHTHIDPHHTTELTLASLPGLEELVAATRELDFDQRSVTHRDVTLRLIGRRLDGPGDNVVVSIDDITAEVEAIAARVRSEQTFKATFDHTPAGISLVAPDGELLDLNPAWSSITGYPRDELVGRTWQEITHPDDLEADQGYVAEILQGERETYRIEKRYRHRTGQWLWVDLRVAAVRHDDGEVVHFVSQILDITAAKQVEADMRARARELTHQATHDHLTGLPNRALLDEHLRVAIERSGRRQDLASVLMIDLDDFKPINDTWGHAVGDQVLVELAGRLSAACRGGDIVARLGGDEFVAVADPVSSDTDGRDLAERLLAVISQPLTSTPERTTVTASIGIASTRADDTIESLLARADQATYTAKAKGGGTFAAHETRGT